MHLGSTRLLRLLESKFIIFEMVSLVFHIELVQRYLSIITSGEAPVSCNHIEKLLDASTVK